jgi:hypothetical protein
MTKYDAQKLTWENWMSKRPEIRDQNVIKKKAQIFSAIESAAKNGETKTTVPMTGFSEFRGDSFGLLYWILGIRETPDFQEIVEALRERGFTARSCYQSDEGGAWTALEISWK